MESVPFRAMSLFSPKVLQFLLVHILIFGFFSTNCVKLSSSRPKRSLGALTSSQGWGDAFEFLDTTVLERDFPSSTRLALMEYVEHANAGGTFPSPIDADVLVMAPTVLQHLGEYQNQASADEFGNKDRQGFNLNVGRALEALRRELPMVFAATNLDFSVFANEIMVIDQRQNKIVMHKNIYVAAVKSLRMAAAISSMYPTMNVKKIEYIEADKTIQCLVSVVLPDSVRIDGQAVWEGMFYFGLDGEGLINSHTFDRKVSTKGPQPLNTQLYPWLRSMPLWSPDLVSIPIPDRGALVRASEQS